MSVFNLLIGIVIAPIICFLYSLFLVIQRIFRTVTDIIMLFLIKRLGRAPSRDSVIAKKISGPGMSRKHFMSIDQEDVYILTQCILEKTLF